jgi:hypothetical protein
MADAIYPKFKYQVLNQNFTLDLNGNLFVALVETDSTGGDVNHNAAYDAADEFFDDIFPSLSTTGPNLANGVIATVSLTSANTTSVAANAIFDAADAVFSAVAAFNGGGGAGTGDGNAILVYANGTNASDSRLIAWLDTVTGLPVVPNATDINLNWSASGIFEL